MPIETIGNIVFLYCTEQGTLTHEITKRHLLGKRWPSPRKGVSLKGIFMISAISTEEQAVRLVRQHREFTINLNLIPLSDSSEWAVHFTLARRDCLRGAEQCAEVGERFRSLATATEEGFTAAEAVIDGLAW